MFNIPETYELIKEFDLSDISSKGYLLRHKKSGARLSLVENDDNNKVFFIAFRTTPTDSTGVAHILEHSVLCGSEKYPLKDPFVELAKGSLNTFLNAMTYPDKTVYPIASTNDKDFHNLTDVYMDAVLNPNIYKNEKIFRQEGWHYELKDGELIYNGVVYNEMKGAFSTADDVLEREILNTLFPDNTYAFESGGDPANIPNLTYEDFLAFHGRYYHPSNSYIYLYGDCDMEERLLYLDREYLSKYDAIDPGSDINMQESFDSVKNVAKDYPIAVGDDTEHNSYFSKNFVVGSILDPELYQAFSVIDYALLNSPGAPMREALMKKSIGKDIIGGYQNGTLQPYFSIGVKGARPGDAKRFNDTITATLKEVVSNGLDKKSLLAAINIQEFLFREADFGSYPKGLVYGLICMDSWLYDDNAPYLHLNAIPIFNDLKKKVQTDYFERLIEKYFLNNNHCTNITLSPKEGLGTEREKEVSARLSEYKDGLSKSDIDDIDNECQVLKAYQEEPTSPEDLRKLPLLTREDLSPDINPIKNRLEKIDGVDVLFHDVTSNGINYLNLLFDVGDIDKDDVPALSLMIRMMGLLDTKGHSYADLSNDININTGGIYTNLQVFTLKDSMRAFINVGSKFLREHTRDAIELSLEMMLDTLYEDEGRMRELLNQELQHSKMRMTSAGHMVASGRALSRISKASYYRELTGGIEFYEYLKDFDANYKDRIGSFKDKCRELTEKIFKKGGLLINETGDRDLTSEIESFVPVILDRISDAPMGKVLDYGLLDSGNEAFKTAAAIQYVARVGNFISDNRAFNGAIKVLKTILSYEYFWIKVRVMGGAYGCMSLFNRTGDTYFVSYRDPNLIETDNVFSEAADFVSGFDCENRDMTKYVIGTISGMDTPLTPSAEGDRGLASYIQGITEAMLKQERAEVLSADVNSIRALSKYIEAAMEPKVLCVLGSESAIDEAVKADSSLFSVVNTLV